MLITADGGARHEAGLGDRRPRRRDRRQLRADRGRARRSVEDGVTIIGPLNLPATMPAHASQLYAQQRSRTCSHSRRRRRRADARLRRRDRRRRAASPTSGEIRHTSRWRPATADAAARRAMTRLDRQLTSSSWPPSSASRSSRRCRRMLHTPLMSATNAIHGDRRSVGAIVVAGAHTARSSHGPRHRSRSRSARSTSSAASWSPTACSRCSSASSARSPSRGRATRRDAEACRSRR